MAEAAFGVQLRRSRQAAALSLRQLATRVGYDHSYLSQVERGRRPGSAHLARLCDRALATPGHLTAVFAGTRTTPSSPGSPSGPGSPGAPVPPTAATGPDSPGTPGEPGAPGGSTDPGPPSGARPGPAGGGDPLEAARHGLTGTFGRVRPADEWSLLAAGYAADLATTPAAELLPELVDDVALLQKQVDAGAAGLTEAAAEFAVLVALTLSALGRSRAAGRWWRTAQLTADSSTERWIASQTRSSQALDRPAAPSALPRQLALAVEAGALAEHPREQAKAHAARARALALLGRSDEAGRAEREAAEAAARSSADGGPVDSSVFAWPSYRTHALASFVHAAREDTASAYAALDRALPLCPPDWHRERAELHLRLAECLVLDGDTALGLSMAMRRLVELEDQWHTPALYDAAARVLAVVPAADLARPAVRDYRELLRRRPFATPCSQQFVTGGFPSLAS